MTTSTDALLDDLHGPGAIVPPGAWTALLGRLHADAATGFIWWRDGFCSAALRLDGGAIRGAAFADETGLPALIRCITRTSGLWCFTTRGSVPENIHHDTAEILAKLGAVLAAHGLLPPVEDTEEVPADSPMNSTQVFRGFHPPALGTVLGRCELVEELGRGATSVVYRARHRSLQIDVAVKVLLRDPDTDAQQQLSANEARLLARLNHPAILRVHDYEEEGQWPYLVIEYVAGPTLAQVIRERAPLPPEFLLPVLEQVASGLAHAQASAGVIHCDLKPSNVLLGADGQAKIADLGLARSVQRRVSGIAPAEPVPGTAISVAGTPAYIAPEQVTGGVAAADHRSDMYALGAIAYQALSGRTPYVEQDPVQLMLAHTRGGFPSLDQLAPNLPAALCAWVHTLLARQPEDRYPDYERLLASLHRAGSTQRRTSIFKNLLGRWW